MTSPLHPAADGGHRRAMCVACLRAQSACICRWVAQCDNAVDLLILQHPMEVVNAKGSARLLHLSLARSRLEVGEMFAPETLAQWLTADGRRPVLLYPETVEAGGPVMAPGAPFDAAWCAQPERLRLVVLDGTWRKSRKMLYLNPALQSLPRLPLRDTPPSHYLIRKAHLPDQLSTLEATCYALQQLEGRPVAFEPLITAFDGFVGQQQGYAQGARGPR
ncbi:DTW domain-containing protein [Duganella sp. LX20W]|uniref:tRNA-uridine aminocarboxypropyltransferase n=1 Tax=Rugamonas brunnea TaxID=2758569 RepID=A0A7W2EVS6_9BURK|nr:tRNA-uridine aminocarboxypropyltransferase [Rugamonas brunnea]MBA5639485.1 DTW domain-containing protein [Rugamonas brunnea]